MERRSVKLIFILLVLFIALIAVGWLGFQNFEDMSPARALSATVNVISMVGLGEMHATRTQTYVLIGVLELGAVGIVAILIAILSQVMITGTLKKYLGRYRMDERISSLKDHFIIVGYSLTGESLIRDLKAEGKQFVIIEMNPDTITKMEEQGLLYVEGDATDESILKAAGIERARGLFAVLSNDSDNLMVVLSARGLNEKLKIVSRSTREDYLQRFHRAGADSAISPQEWASRRMIQAILRPRLLRLLSTLLDPAISHAYLDECEVPQDSQSIGKTLGELNIRGKSGIVILGIMRSDGECITSLGPDSVIEDGDVLIGFGERQNFANLEKLLRVT